MRNDSGATAIEYGLIAAGIAVVIITAVQLIGSNLSGTFNSVASAVGRAVSLNPRTRRDPSGRVMARVSPGHVVDQPRLADADGCEDAGHVPARGVTGDERAGVAHCDIVDRVEPCVYELLGAGRFRRHYCFS
jgi:pilus assembly protein Flp/PilA